jgi:hypothetical protein
VETASLLVSTGLDSSFGARNESRKRSRTFQGPSLTTHYTEPSRPRRLGSRPWPQNFGLMVASNAFAAISYFCLRRRRRISMTLIRGSTLVAWSRSDTRSGPFSFSHCSSCSHGDSGAFFRAVAAARLRFSLISRTYADAGTAVCRSIGCLPNRLSTTPNGLNVECRDKGSLPRCPVQIEPGGVEP